MALELEVLIGRIWQLSLVIIKNLKYPQAVMENFVRVFQNGFYSSEKCGHHRLIHLIFSLPSFHPPIFHLSTHFLFHSFTLCFTRNLIHSFSDMIQSLQVSLTVYLSSSTKSLTFGFLLQKDCLL